MQQLTDLEIMRYIPRTLTTEIDMNTQPEALRWAYLLEHEAAIHGATDYKHKAAAELRRLHEVNQELLEALKDAAQCVQDNYLPDMMGHDWDHIIAKATGG